MPSITVSLRGLTYFQLDVFGSPVDLHSGVYGGAVDNPINALCQIVAALKRPDGRVSVPGFYDDVVEPSPLEREALARLPFDEAAYRESIGVPALIGEPGYTVLERLGMRPTLDVDGIWGGFEGEGPKTIIPAHAHAKISCRLVADQDPEKIFQAVAARIGEVAPETVRYSIQRLGDGRPSAVPIDHPATQAAARALAASFGSEPLYAREGGSVPVCASFEHDSRPADRAPRVRAARRPVPRPERVDVHAELRNRHPGHRQILGRSRRHAKGSVIEALPARTTTYGGVALCSLDRCLETPALIPCRASCSAWSPAGRYQ